MNGPSLRRLKLYAAGRLKRKRYFARCGDGRPQPRIPARAILWALLTGQLLRQPDGTVVQADWFTNFSQRKAVSLALYRMAKSRWKIENQGCNDCQTYQGLEHISHHHPNRLLLCWLLTLLALVISRLYRLRYLHRGTHHLLSACHLVRLLWLELGRPLPRESG